MENSIFIEQNIPLLENLLSTLGSIRRFKGREIENAQLRQSLCTALFVRSTTQVNEKLLKNTNVKFVGTATSGTDHIDIEYLRKNDIAFSSAFGSNANSVAEYVVYSILQWAEANKISLVGKNIGIIGYGNIGSRVAYYAMKLGMKIHVNDPPLRDLHFKFPNYAVYAELEELAVKSDVLTNHVPLNISGNYPSSNLLNERIIGLIPDGSLLIHTSRGGIADEKALLKRLEKQEITAVIDVWDREPKVNAMLAERCELATPHTAGYSYDGKIKGALMIAEDFAKFNSLKLNEEILSGINSNRRFVDFESSTDLFHELKESRMIDDDSDRFKKTLELSEENRITAFDELRKTYPERYEILKPFI